MSARKSERLLNLVICLLVARTYVTKERIREVVEGYAGLTPDAFEKMFERDKDELRDLGIPIEMGTIDKFFSDDIGYRIRRDVFELPEVHLEPDEAAVLGVAARVWQHASLAEATSSAVLKLKAAGIQTDQSALSAIEPHVGASEPAFDPLWSAVVTRTVVTFEHLRSGAAKPTKRTLEPWGIVSWHGRWYVVGRDRDREATRMFRLSRIGGNVKTIGSPQAFTVPAGTDLRGLVSELAPPPPTSEAKIRARAGSCVSLRRRATAVEPYEEGWDLLHVPYADAGVLAEEIASYGPQAVVDAPGDVLDGVLRRLREVAGVPV
ncbi:helix-turn-helix transcriptional regulator [Kribbella deserti]|uniref:Helix-turn-helix transcriptional regulator n=1 Tax=Kribbella deserti TaxID=1926257 RepID=A0ABV6QQ22_9ACTN